MRRPLRVSAVLSTAALAFAACSGNGASNGDTAGNERPIGDRPTAEAFAASDSPLPAVEVVDVVTNETVALAGLLPADKPTLVWMWAPHRAVCRAESPAVEQFAHDNADKLTTVGLGTQDDLDDARDFVEKGGITFTMLWDSSFQSWVELGIHGQPAAILFTADGTKLRQWVGPSTRTRCSAS